MKLHNGCKRALRKRPTVKGRPMNLSQLHYFVALADEKHFANAANKLFIARSTLSNAISQLEGELGVPLFQKRGSTFILTDYGDIFYRQASLALENIEMGKRAISELAEGKNQILRVGVPYALQSEEWSRLMREFEATCSVPVTVEVVQGFSTYLLRNVSAGSLDVTFASKTPDAPESLTYVPYWSHELGLAVHKENPLASRSSVAFDELVGAPILTYREGCPPHDEIEAAIAGCALETVETYSDEISICSAVSADTGARAFVAYSYLIKAFDSVVMVPIEGVPKEFHKMYLVSRSEKDASPLMKEFLAFAKTHPVPAGVIPRK